VPVAGAKFRVERYIYEDVDETVAPGDQIISSSVAFVESDANGAYSESHTFADPSSTKDSYTYADIYIAWDTDGDNNYDEEDYVYVYLEWNDDKSVPTDISLSGPDAADMDGFATVTVTVSDQYGDACSTGCLVRFDWTNDNAAGFESADERTLNAQGKASITIGGPGSNLIADNDVVAVRVDDDDTTTGWQDPGADDDTHTVAWYDDAPTDLGVATTTLIDVNTAGDYFIGAGPALSNWKFTYDADDQFSEDGAATTFAAFEVALDSDDYDTVDMNYDRDGTAPDVSTFNI
jgi:hypothetical protein